MNKDKIIGHIDEVPVHKDSDFENNYVRVQNWLIKYKNIKMGPTTSSEKIKSILSEDLMEEFEEWCEYHNITPICVL